MQIINNNYTYDQDFYKNLNNKQFFNLAVILGMHSTTLLLGGGFEAKAEDEKKQDYIDSYAQKYNFDEFLWNVGFWASIKGASVITINKNKQGEPFMEIADPNLNNQLAKVQQTEYSAVLWKRPIQDMKNTLIREEWDKEWVRRRVFIGGKEVSLAGFNKKIDPEDQVVEAEKHGFGFVPIVIYKNKPLEPRYFKSNIDNKGVWETLADIYPVSDLAQGMNITQANKYKEMVVNRSRYFGVLSKQQIKEIQNGKSELRFFFDDYYLELEQLDVRKDSGSTIQMGDPKLATYDASLDADFSRFFEGAGYSNVKDSEIQTATQQLYSKDRDVKTTNMKRNLMIDAITKAFNMLLLAKNLITEDEYHKADKVTFTINSAFVPSETEKLANVQTKLTMGVIDKLGAIAEINNIDEKEAQVLLDRVKQEEEQQMERNRELMNITGALGFENPNPNKPKTAEDEDTGDDE